MNGARTAAPMKMGLLLDVKMPEKLDPDARADICQPFELVFADAYEQRAGYLVARRLDPVRGARTSSGGTATRDEISSPVPPRDRSSRDSRAR